MPHAELIQAMRTLYMQMQEAEDNKWEEYTLQRDEISLIRIALEVAGEM